jgi:hypothetical protein
LTAGEIFKRERLSGKIRMGKKETTSIHRTAVQVFGGEARIRYLWTELTEAALACSRYLDGRGTLQEVIDEVTDVRFVSHSLRYIGKDTRPLSEQGEAKYQDGLTKLAEAIRRAKAEITQMTIDEKR